MKAAYVNRPGPAESIRYGDLPLPVLNAEEVLVRIKAVSVNHVDTYVRSGALPIQLPTPFVIGRDMVGVVEALGVEVQEFKVGQLVWSNCLGIGGLQGPSAEYVAAPQDRLYLLPPGIEPKEAVAVVHSALTAVIGLFAKAQVAAGDTVFINGGSGSVGLAVLQIAKACGARVGVTAGDEEKAEWCRRMGADLVVDHRREDVCRAMRVLAPGGLDVYWETTAALDCEKVLPLMAQHGRLIIVAGRGHLCNFPVGPFYLRNCSMHGFTVTGTSVSDLRAYARQINAWLANQTLTARIQEIMPLADAARAHQKQEEGKLFGKIVLTPGG